MKNNFFIALTASIFVTGCGAFLANSPDKEPQLSGVLSIPLDFKINSNCLVDKSSDTCLFLKNPVFQSQQSFGTKVSANSDLKNLQVVEAKLNLPTSSFLENDTIRIYNANGERARATGNRGHNQWHFEYSADPDEKWGQVMAYYWLSYAVAKSHKDVGLSWLQGKRIPVYVNDGFSGWSSIKKSIHLQSSRAGAGQSVAANAGLMVHYLGLANLYYATEGRFLSSISNLNHDSCGPPEKPDMKNACCKSDKGCGKALASGAADYFAATIFPESPTLGETWTNNTDGISNCGISRNLNLSKDVTVTQSFQSCANSIGNGYFYPLGTIYASIWWEIRKNSASVQGSDKEVDQLFHLHLQDLTGNDTFETAFNKIKSRDRQHFSGKYLNLFATEFTRRGLSVQ